jgi:dUTPase
MIIHRVYQAGLEEVSSLDKTSRNAGGFGHTGK